MLAKHQARAQSDAYNHNIPAHLRFLFALDDAALAKVVSSMIETHGHEVCAVGAAKEAIETLETKDFDIVVVDMTLPNANDILALQALRDRDQELQRHTPVIAMTKFESADVAMDEWVGLLDAYVNSPLEPERFFTIVNRVLARSSSWS